VNQKTTSKAGILFLKKNEAVIIYFCAGNWAPYPMELLRYPIYLLSKKYNVLFVEPPLTLRDKIKKKKLTINDQQYDALRHLPGTKMHIFKPKVPCPYSVRLPLLPILKNFILEYNRKSISKQVMKVFKKLYPEKDQPDIVWGTIFHHAYFFKHLKGRHNLAIINDNFPVSPVFSTSQQEEVAKMEKKLIQQSEYIFTSSQTLYEEKIKLNPNTVMLENGVLKRFLPKNRDLLEKEAKKCSRKEWNIIEDLKKIPRPRIGYIGAINIRLSSSLLHELTKLPEKYHTCFFGKIDDSFPEKTAKVLKNSKQVHFFPYVSHHLVPYIFEEFDILLLPFDLINFTHFINPLKLSEYLSSGKPIITTPIYEVKRIVSKPEGLAYFINEMEDLKDVIDKALKEDNETLQKMRIELAKKRIWENSTKEMISTVDRLLDNE
jgi:glycosyltransferase involved in cell wall biosynthesis